MLTHTPGSALQRNFYWLPCSQNNLFIVQRKFWWVNTTRSHSLFIAQIHWQQVHVAGRPLVLSTSEVSLQFVVSSSSLNLLYHRQYIYTYPFLWLYCKAIFWFTFQVGNQSKRLRINACKIISGCGGFTKVAHRRMAEEVWLFL